MIENSGLEPRRVMAALEESASNEAFPNRYVGILHQFNAEIMACTPSYPELRDETVRSILEGFAPGQKILELGAGQGDSARPVLDASKEVALDLLDVSPEMIRDAQERLAEYGDRLHFITDDAFQYLTRCEPYDTIFSQFTVHNFTRENKKKLFKAVHNKLKDGGRFILLDKVYPKDKMLGEQLIEMQRERYRAGLPSDVADAIIAHEDEDYYNAEICTQEDEIRAMLTEAGFTSIQIVKRIERDVILEAVR